MCCTMWGTDLKMCESRISDNKTEKSCPSCLNVSCFFNTMFVNEGDKIEKSFKKRLDVKK